MNLGESEKIQVTNAIREAFPEVKVDRKTIEGKRKTIYKGLRKKIPFRLVATDQASSSTDQASTSQEESSALEWESNSDIKKLKLAIQEKDNELNTVRELMNKELSLNELNKENFQVLF